MTAEALHSEFSATLLRVANGKERLVETRKNKRVAALIPIEDLELLEAVEDHIDSKLADEVLAEIEREGSIPWEQAKRDLGL